MRLANDPTKLVRSFQVNVEFKKTKQNQFCLKLKLNAVNFIRWIDIKNLPGGRDLLSKAGGGELLDVRLGVVFTTGLLGATETRKREVLVDLVEGAVELVRPESPAWSLPEPAARRRPSRGRCCLFLSAPLRNRENRTELTITAAL